MNREELEWAVDIAWSSPDADARAARRGLPLADFECAHGRLPSEPCVHCERRRMSDMLDDLKPEERAEDEVKQNIVPCKVCGKPAPQFGKYAGRCPDHRGSKSKAKATKKQVVALVSLDEIVEAARVVADAKAEYDIAQQQLVALVSAFETA